MTDTRMFSVADELNKLAPLNLDTGLTPTDEVYDAVQQWDELAQTLARLGKQQMKATQIAELLGDQVGEAVTTLRNSTEAVQEQLADYHSQLENLRRDAQEVRRHVLEFIDVLDDLTTIAKQREDMEWLSRAARLTTRVLEVLSRIGLTEIPAFGRQFNEEEHEALGATDASSEQERYRVVEVVRRGFRFGGAVLRRSQVISTR